MSRELKRAIVKSLRVAGARGEDLEALASFTEREWNSVSEWLDLSGLALVFADRLHKMGALDVVPRKTRLALLTNLIENQRRVTAMKAEFANLNSLFDRAEIGYVVWKGFALYPDFFPNPCLRPSYDYDYLIANSSWQEAQKILLTAGYAQRGTAESKTHVTFLPAASAVGSAAGLYSIDLPRKVELHLSPVDEETAGLELGLPAIRFERNVRKQWGEIDFSALPAREAFDYQAVHAFHHILQDWCRLGWLWEIAYFAQRHAETPSLWSPIADDPNSTSCVREIKALVLNLGLRLFKPALSASLEADLARNMRGSVAMWITHFGIKGALDQFARGKSSLFLYREFVGSEAGWDAIRNRRLFPIHRPNRVPNAVTSGTVTSARSYVKKVTYLLRRLVHHTARGIDYAWESRRWNRVRKST